jgi:hypothetical protein
MKYPEGAEVRMGDRVELWDGNAGVVVCSIDSNEYSVSYPQAAWAQLGKGVLILSEKAGLIHYEEPERTMRLLSRQS